MGILQLEDKIVHNPFENLLNIPGRIGWFLEVNPESRPYLQPMAFLESYTDWFYNTFGIPGIQA